MYIYIRTYIHTYIHTSFKQWLQDIRQDTQRLKTISEAILLEEQNGFRRGRSCIDNVFILNQTTEKEGNLT
jgi:hypothetical protein